MIDRHARLEQYIAKKCEGLFAANALSGDRFADKLLQLGFFFWKAEFWIGLGNPANGEFDDIQSHVDNVDVNIVHVL